MESILTGAMVSGGLIVAIGAQNAFVLKQGLLGKDIFWVVLTCFLCDVMLMTMGVLGLGAALSQNRIATIAMAIMGGIFLAWYGTRAFFSAWRASSYLEAIAGDPASSHVHKTLLTTLAVTLLNPHVYLDTVLIVGGVAGTLAQDEKMKFLTGSLLASLCWFFGLGYGARLLQPLFRDVKTWQILDVVTGSTMWWISIKVMQYGLGAYQD